MELRRYSFPKAARALTVVAAIASASALAAFPAAAQQAKIGRAHV